MAKKNWFWELRNNGEFLPPNITNVDNGWNAWKGPLANGPSFTAEIFVRELVQNFVDAAREQKTLSNSDFKPSLKFVFVELTGVRAVEVAEVLALPSHVHRYQSMNNDDRLAIRLGKSEVLEGTYEPLRLLVVVESGTTGMYGPWDMTAEDVPRKMRSALLATVGEKSGGGLGANGEGKRAIIASSSLRTMLVSTCFKAQSSTGDTNRALIGATYWRKHTETDGLNATGLALLGDDSESGPKRVMEDRPIPLVNDAVDEFLLELNIPHFDVRNPNEERDLGTSQLFIEPNINAAEVVSALERNWWPLIAQDGATFEVIDYDGSHLTVNPRSRPELVPFLDIEQNLRESGGENGTTAHALTKDIDLALPNVQGPAGRLGLAVNIDDGGWSWHDRENNYNLVALVRDGMLIEYAQFPRSQRTPPPFVRGVFVTDSQIYASAAELLRIVEPPLHNKFTESGAGFDPAALQVAKRLYERLDTDVREFRKRFRDTPNPSEGAWEDFSEVFGEPEQPLPPSPPRPPIPPLPPTGPTSAPTSDPWTNQTVETDVLPESSDPLQIQVKASRKIALKKTWSEEKIRVRIRVTWEVLGEKSWAVEDSLYSQSTVVVPLGFIQDSPNDWIGELTKDEVLISWMSKSYDDLWTVKPVIQISKED
jgi:hypothetical protein